MTTKPTVQKGNKVTKVAGAVAKVAKGQHRSINNLRGLAEAKMGVKRADTFRVEPLVLQIEPNFNVRVAGDPELRAHIDSIKATIRDYITRHDPENRHCELIPSDIIPDLIVRVTEEGEIFLVDGHCRTTAIRELIEEGFVIEFVGVKSTAEDRKGRIMIMVRSSQGKDLAPIEKAKAFVELADEGMSFHEIARAMPNTVTPQRVEQLVLLGRAPQSVIRLVEEKRVTADSALEVVRKHRDNPAEAERILLELVNGKEEGDRPVGKGETRVSIPKKAQEGIYAAVVSESKTLNKQIKALEISGEEGWEEKMVNVTLPAGLVKQLLDQQARKAGKAEEATGEQ